MIEVGMYTTTPIIGPDRGGPEQFIIIIIIEVFPSPLTLFGQWSTSPPMKEPNESSNHHFLLASAQQPTLHSPCQDCSTYRPRRGQSSPPSRWLVTTARWSWCATFSFVYPSRPTWCLPTIVCMLRTASSDECTTIVPGERIGSLRLRVLFSGYRTERGSGGTWSWPRSWVLALPLAAVLSAPDVVASLAAHHLLVLWCQIIWESMTKFNPNSYRFNKLMVIVGFSVYRTNLIVECFLGSVSLYRDELGHRGANLVVEDMLELVCMGGDLSYWASTLCFGRTTFSLPSFLL